MCMRVCVRRAICVQASKCTRVCVVFVYILFVVLFAQFATFSSHSSTKCALGFNIAFCLLLYFSYCLFFIDFEMLLHFVDTLTIAHTHTQTATHACPRTHRLTHMHAHTLICAVCVCFKRSAVCNFDSPHPLLHLFLYSLLAEVVYYCYTI